MIVSSLMVRESACVDLQSISTIGSNRTRTKITINRTRMHSAATDLVYCTKSFYLTELQSGDDYKSNLEPS